MWPVGYAANFIHHKYKGRLLNPQQLDTAASFFNQHLNDEGIVELRNYIANRDCDSFLLKAEECTTSLAYWSLLKHKYKNLSALAMKIMIIPAST